MPTGPPSDCDDAVNADLGTFARLAGGRWTGDEARVKGAVRVEGDSDLGNRIIDNMAFTI